jgi:hypothetical protein
MKQLVYASSGNTIEELTVREEHKPASIMKGAILNRIRSVKLLLTYLNNTFF